jgi:hypothetical protein
MPEWVVHFYTGENFCGIGRKVYEEVNRFIDLSVHDVNRVIVDGHWLPESLFYLALVSYEKWGCEGLKAVIHHNILDYLSTLASEGKYGWLVKYHGPSYAITDIMRFCGKVLDGIRNDFITLCSVLKGKNDPHEILLEVGKVWGSIQTPKDFVNALKGERTKLLKLLEDMLKIVNELKSCIHMCVEEVVWLEFYREFKGICPVCSRAISPLETYISVPMEYAEKNLAYKVHKECFEILKTKANEILKQGLTKEKVFRALPEKSMPPSIIHEVLKMIA